MKTNVLRPVCEINDHAVFRLGLNRPCAKILFRASLTRPAEDDPTGLLASPIYPQLYGDMKQKCVSKCARVLSYSSRHGERKTDEIYCIYVYTASVQRRRMFQLVKKKKSPRTSGHQMVTSLL